MFFLPLYGHHLDHPYHSVQSQKDGGVAGDRMLPRRRTDAFRLSLSCWHMCWKYVLETPGDIKVELDRKKLSKLAFL